MCKILNRVECSCTEVKIIDREASIKKNYTHINKKYKKKKDINVKCNIISHKNIKNTSKIHG